MKTSDDQKVSEYWTSFIQKKAPSAEAISAGYEAWSFGNTPEMANRLGNLVLQGVKTATASLLWSYESGDEPTPKVGEYSILLDGQGFPICIVQTTKLETVPFDEVKDEHAYLEGEGDRSLQYWREVHWTFFEEECRIIGRHPDLKMPVVCERFKLVYRSS